MAHSERGLFNCAKSCIAFALVLMSLMGFMSSAWAGESEDDAAFGSVRSSQDKAHRRAYAGGRDEEDLTVQASLPQPVRSPDAVPGALGVGEEAAHD